ncbi:UbiD family decarboxylase [Propylenella binzhouense]|uniref:UbiD family decarboxylase n=1 Tax=Propylenella binzhouense TaxID=2555902 RepID=A0A964T313_9HYPH|nr:UbiD family decarboxylase [Propylenella binzhouense]MYZ47543.1 UbiD family decarboxylase [Propylenella binzhouense]
MLQTVTRAQDLRTWIAEMETAGELKRISGADREREIGGIVDIYQRKIGGPALLFDKVPGYDPNYRVLANLFVSVKRIALTLGLPETTREIDLVRFWRDNFKDHPMIPPTEVESGPVMENVFSGDEIDLLKIPTPRWHEGDGGYYIGTGCMVVMRDPDTGWVNYGAYRVQVHDRNVASVMASKGKHGDMIKRRYHERGEPCPIAVVVGVHPGIFSVAGLEIPYGNNEYDAAGGLLGESIRVVKGPKTGLPIPADAEIAFEGYVHPDDLIDEGPLGEWTGYYAGGLKKEPAIRVETFMHRDDPILTGCIPAVPPNDDTFYRGTYRAGAVWHEIEAAGVPEVKGVWSHEAGGSRMWLTVAIRQMYAGHSKQAGLIASQCHAGAYANRMVVVVDEDVNPADMDQVVWAICTRCDPREDVEILKGCWSTTLDPMAYPEDRRNMNSRMVIDACKPWNRIADWPALVRSSKALDDHVRARFADVLPAWF